MAPRVIYSSVARVVAHTLSKLEPSGLCALCLQVFADMEAPRPEPSAHTRVRLANEYASRQLGASETLKPYVAKDCSRRSYEGGL